MDMQGLIETLRLVIEMEGIFLQLRICFHIVEI